MEEFKQGTDAQGLPWRYAEITESTNIDAVRWAQQGAPHGALVTAACQRAGRGRLGRSFFSPPGGLYMSMVVRNAPAPGVLTTLAAVAASQEIEERFGVQAAIKWVNDLIVEGRKVAGILAQGVAEGGEPAVILGIGVNLGPVRFPQELEKKAAALLTEFLPPPQTLALAQAIRGRVLQGLEQGTGHMDQYRARCLTIGREVLFDQQRSACRGLALQVEDDGTLLVRTAQGMVRLLAGEASVRLADGRYV